MHAASSAGYYVSFNGGATWDKTKAGRCFAMALHPTDSGVVYAAFKGDGLYKSTNNGFAWDPVPTPGYPGSDYLSGDLAICKSQPETMWLLLSTISANALTTVLRTDYGGSFWVDFGLPPIFPRINPATTKPSR